MEYNRLRLTQEENELITKRYPDTDFAYLMDLAEGMSTIRNIDLLISSIEYDIGHKNVEEEYVDVLKKIKDKAIYYRDHNGKNYVEGFDADYFCKKADEISMAAIREEIGTDFYKIDQSINYIRTLKERFDTEKKQWKVAVCLGTKLGELMLDDKLLNLGFDWGMKEPKKYPVLIEPRKGMSVDPIFFVFNKIRSENPSGDSFVNCSDLYYRFLDDAERQL